jgi:hypothetical protein
MRWTELLPFVVEMGGGGAGGGATGAGPSAFGVNVVSPVDEGVFVGVDVAERR